jgi:predicted RND superfamily exporter protein
VDRLTSFSLDHPKLTLAVLALITLVLGAAAPSVKPEYGYRVLIGDDHPAIQALDGFIARFGGGLPVHISWACEAPAPCTTVFDPASLKMAAAIEAELASTDGIYRVEGIAGAPLLVPTPDGFAVRRMIENGEIPSDIDALAKLAVQDRFWLGELVSADAKVGVVIVQPVDTDAETDALAFEAIDAALAPFEGDGFVFYLTGQSAGNIISGRDLASSTGRLVPVTVAAIALVLLLLSRSASLAFVALATIGVAIVWTLGIMGHLEWPQDGIHEVLVPFILVIGVCDTIHFLACYSTALFRDPDAPHDESNRRALMEAASEVGPACLITTLTTVAAFLSFTTSTLDTFFRFGSIAAVGVAACLLLTFTLAPILMLWVPVRSSSARRTSAAWGNFLRNTVTMSEQRTYTILAGTGVLLIVFAYGWAAYLRVDVNWNESLGEKSFVTQSVRFVESHLGPSRHLEIELALPAETALEAPETLAIITQLSEQLPEVDGLSKTTSVVDLIGQLNRLVHDNDEAFDRIAETTAGNAELIEIVSIDDDTLLGSWVDLDRTRIRISVDAPERSQAEGAVALLEVEQLVRSIVPDDWGLVLSGFVAINNDWVHDIQATQLRSFPTALAIVVILVGLFLRSAKLALASLVPTLIPVVVTLGVMGWLGLNLDVGRAMIAAVMIGIGVDDSIHILSRYKQQRDSGQNANAAIKDAVLHTGRAVITTSAALSLGFMTLMLSAWQSISSFGFFISVGILGALVSSLLVLPALIFATASSD